MKARFWLPLVFFGLFTTFALAQGGTPDLPPDLPPGFEPVAGAPSTEQVDANKLVVAAYMACFLGLFGYLMWIAKQQKAISGELENLKRKLEDKAAP